MRRSICTRVLALVACQLALSGSAGAQDSTDNAGSCDRLRPVLNLSAQTLYVTSPACNSFKCSSQWPQGTDQFVVSGGADASSSCAQNWLLAPTGNVSVTLNNSTSSNTPIVITSSTAGTSPSGTCDNRGQSSCGRVRESST